MRLKAKKDKPARVPPRVAGWREWCALPEFGVMRIKAKLDTGARTSALHAFDIEPLRRAGETWVKFKLHPAQRSTALTFDCDARVVDHRWIRNPGRRRERRYVIATDLILGGRQWPIELALTSRDEMGFRLLLGRTALAKRILIDPARSFRLDGPEGINITLPDGTEAVTATAGRSGR
jgi:hypothetical protein